MLFRRLIFASAWVVSVSTLGCSPGPAPGDVAQCEITSDRCAQGQGYETCCSDRGCSFLFFDGQIFVRATDARTYCAGDPNVVSQQNAAPQTPPNVSQPTTGGGPTSPGPREEVGPGGGPITGEDPPREGEGAGTDNGSSNNSSSNGGCYGSAVSCGARYSATSCQQDWAGCVWEESYCRGAASSCGYFSSASNCNAQRGCQWSYYYEDCRGGAWQCHNLHSPGVCNYQFGCYWDEGGCFGGARGCVSYSSPSACNAAAGCYWSQ